LRRLIQRKGHLITKKEKNGAKRDCSRTKKKENDQRKGKK